MPKIASKSTLRASKKTRMAYAYLAAERDSLSNDESVKKKGTDALNDILEFRMPLSEQLEWALRELNWRELNY